MCGAFAMSPPPESKIAQEKSSRSLMFTECAVDWSRTPICSAIDMNRFPKISSMTGSAPVPIAVAALLPVVLERSEEHTSELQSHLNLVCRLLLEKKKWTTHTAAV